MNFSLTGHHLEVTPAIREYVMNKMERVKRHFDNVIDLKVTVSVEKLVHTAEVNLHTRGKDIHVAASDANLYAAIDALSDKLDRQVIKHKEKHQDHSQDGHLKQQLNEGAVV